MDLQALMDGLAKRWEHERAETQMTLGKVIKALEEIPGDTEIEGLGALASYRGYYSDLAFEPIRGKRPAADVLVDCCAAMGKMFEGYKGGDYVMGELTPMWVADYGYCGQRLININADGSIETAEED